MTNTSARRTGPASLIDAQRDPPAIRGVKRIVLAAVCIHLVLAGWGLYRRIWQVLRIELRASSDILVPGATVTYDVVTSGETRNRIRLELVQGTHAAILREDTARVNRVNTYDPRLFRSVHTVVITADLLAGFSPGAATLRLTGFGGRKLLRTPPPRTREVSVEISARTLPDDGRGRLTP